MKHKISGNKEGVFDWPSCSADSDDFPGLSGGVPSPHQSQSRPEGPPPAGQQRGMSISHVVSERPGGIVIQQRVDHAVGRREAQRHHHRPLQCHRDVTVPAPAHGVQMQRTNHMIGQKAQQEGCCHHGDQVHRAAPVAKTSFAGQTAAVEAGAGCQAPDDSAIANDDCEEREEEAESQCYIV